MPRELRALTHEGELQARMMRHLEAARQATAAQMVVLRADEQKLLDQEKRAEAKLAYEVNELRRLDEQAVPALLAVLPEDQRKTIEPLLTTDEPIKPLVARPIPPPRLTLDVPRPRRL